MSEKVTVGKEGTRQHTGFLAKNPRNDMGILCSREQGTSRAGKPYDSAQLTHVNMSKKGEWFTYAKRFSPKEMATGKSGVWCPFPVDMLPEVIRALNDLYRDITGESVTEAEETVSQEFDTVGELLKQTGFKDRGR